MYSILSMQNIVFRKERNDRVARITFPGKSFAGKLYIFENYCSTCSKDITKSYLNVTWKFVEESWRKILIHLIFRKNRFSRKITGQNCFAFLSFYMKTVLLRELCVIQIKYFLDSFCLLLISIKLILSNNFFKINSNNQILNINWYT